MSTATTRPQPSFSILRGDVWRTLGRRLDEIVADYAVLGIVRDSVLRPLRLLEAMAADAPAALGDDFFAAERLRALLYLAAPWRALPAEAAQLAGSGPPPQPYQPGVLDHGKLVVVGLAAIRVAPLASAGDLLATVHGLALALSVGEVLGRLEPGAPDGTALETMLLTLVSLVEASGKPSPGLLRPFGLDATERGRWACLADLFGGDALGSFVRERLQDEPRGRVLWDAALSEPVASVDPSAANDGEVIRLHGDFGGRDAEARQVVFVGADGTAQLGEVGRRTSGQLTVVVPRDARSGWIGLSDAARIASTNRYRKTVRDFWSALDIPTVPPRPPGFLSCLRDAPVPVAEVPDLGRVDRRTAVTFSIPPRTAHNRFTAASAATAPESSRRTGSPGSDSGQGDGTVVTVSASQDGLGPPFVAGERVDVTVGFAADTVKHLALVFDPDDPGTRVERDVVDQDTASVTLEIPPDQVGSGTLAFTVFMTPASGGPPERGPNETFAVQGARITGVAASQEKRPLPPFLEGTPVHVVVTFDAGGNESGLDVVLQLGDGTRPKGKRSQNGSVKFVIPGAEVSSKELTFAVSLVDPSGETVDRVDPAPAFAVAPPPPKIGAVTFAQGSSVAPFEAGKPVDLTVTYKPAKSGVTATVSVANTAVASGSGSGGVAKAQIPGAAVKTKSLDLVIALVDDSGQKGSEERSVAVIAPMIIRTVTATQHGAGPPFVRNEPVDVDVRYDPTDTEGVVTIVPSDPDAAPFEATTNEPGHATLQIPSSFVRKGLLVFTVDLEMDGDGAPRATSPQSFAVVEPVGRTIVLFRPTILRPEGPARISDDRRDELVAEVERALKLTLGVVELPWIEDPLAVLGSDVAGAEDPRVPTLFEALSRAAAFTAGFESAPWIVLVPSIADPGSALGAAPAQTAPAGFETHVLAETAVSLVVCNEGGFSQFMAKLTDIVQQNPPRPVLPRLRVIGVVDHGQVTVEPAREETRAAGPGAPIGSGILAVSFDVDGRALQGAPIQTVRQGDVMAFVQLVPVTPEVDRIQLRRGTVVLAELQRPEGAPSLSGFKFAGDTAVPTLEWKYAHTNNATPALDFELFQVVGGTFAFSVDACFNRVPLPVQRLPVSRARTTDPLRVRLVATDEWNTASSPPLDLPKVTDNLIIRRVIGVVTPKGGQSRAFVRLTGAQWWAETTLPGPFEWTLNGIVQKPVDEDGRLIRLDSNARGKLQVVGRNKQGEIALADGRDLT